MFYLSSFADLNSAGARGITFEQAANDIKLGGDIRQIGEVAARIAITDGLLQYNGKKKYAKDIYDDIYYPKTPREQSAFNRSMANKTSGLKEGETKRIIINTADNVYLITADGYMSGNIEQCISLNGSQKVINNYVQEWLNSDTSDEGFNILLETYGDESGGFDSFSLDVRDRRDENRNASVDSKKSYSRRAENTGAGFKDSEISKGKVTDASGVKLSKGEKAILSKIAKDSGVAVVVERFSGTDLASKGFYSGGIVHLNADRLSEGGFTYTGIHEVVHHLKAVNAEGYKAIESFVNNYYKEKGADLDNEVTKTQAYYKSKGVELTPEEAMEEIVCNTLSDIATDEDALSAFLGLDSKSQNKFIEVIKTLVRKLKEWANKFLKNTEYHSIVMNDADTLLHLAKQLRAELTKSKQKNNTANGGVKYSINESFYNQINTWDRETIGFSFVLGTTSDALLEAGIPNKQIRWDASKIKSLLKKHNGMSVKTVLKVPELLENPIVVVDSKKNKNSKIIIGDLYDSNNKPVTVVLLLTPTSKKGNQLDILKVSSAEGRSHIKSLFRYENGESVQIRYIDKNRIQSWLNVNRLQLPLHSFNSDSTNNIPNSIENVKKKQLEIIQKTNPSPNEYSTWVRTVEDIKTLAETLEDDEWADYDEFNPDLTKDDIKEAIERGTITVYSSHPIENGVFVSPSRMEAESYSGTGEVYEKTVDIRDVAWIDPTQGMYAKVEMESKAKKWMRNIFPR